MSQKKHQGSRIFLAKSHHHELLNGSFLNAVEALPHQFSEPFADPSSIPTMIMCQRTQHHLKVALTEMAAMNYSWVITDILGDLFMETFK